MQISIHKTEVELEEADASNYWLTVIKKSELLSKALLNMLIQEANALTAVFTATDKKNKQKSTIENK